MEIATSVPDKLGKATDRSARRLRIPLSRYYPRALDALRCAEEKADITERLNAVYGKSTSRQILSSKPQRPS